MQKPSATAQSERTKHGFGRSSRSKTTLASVAALALLVPILVTATTANSPSYASSVSVLENAVPKTLVDPDTVSVELGAKFTTSQAGTITAIRFFKSTENTGPHVAKLWSARGQVLATATLPTSASTTPGWQTVKLPQPVKIAKDQQYVASYVAPKGRYSVDEHGLDQAKTAGPLTILAGGGVYAYGNGDGLPTSNYQNSNYFVDVEFSPESDSVPTTPAPTTSAPAPTETASPSPTATTKPTTPPTTAPPTTTPPTTAPPTIPGALDLPRIPWEGGSSYWKQFKHANDAGWSDPSFFPIVTWWGGISSNAEAQYDKSLGLNTYIGMSPEAPYSLFQDNNMYWIGGKLNNTFTDSSTNWVGDFLDDEVDGRFSPADGQKHLQSLVDASANDGRFKYANFTSMVVRSDMKLADSQKYVNAYTDAISVDMYWYTVPECSWTPYRMPLLVPVQQENCRTSSSYGKTVKALREQDAADGKLQPIWQFVENLGGGPGGGAPVVYITGEQLKGAVMDSIINEARGIVYFNQSFAGPCQSGNVFRQAQVIKDFCGAKQVAAAKEVNLQIQQLAPVINTQSYAYTFGPGLDTMLKTHDGSTYIFSMINGESQPGDRSFQLPKGIAGDSVEVMFEGRNLPIVDGTFQDKFSSESQYHIYKITP